MSEQVTIEMLRELDQQVVMLKNAGEPNAAGRFRQQFIHRSLDYVRQLLASPTPPAGDAGAVAWMCSYDDNGTHRPCKKHQQNPPAAAPGDSGARMIADLNAHNLELEERLVDAERLLKQERATPTGDSVRVPSGWKLVPIDPTDEMIEACMDEEVRQSKLVGFQMSPRADRYRAMLAAAPQQAAAVPVDGWFIGGPNATAIVYDRQHIEPVLMALCDTTGDDMDEYTVTDCLEPQQAEGGWPTVDDAMVEAARSAILDDPRFAGGGLTPDAMRVALQAALPLPPGEGVR